MGLRTSPQTDLRSTLHCIKFSNGKFVPVLSTRQFHSPFSSTHSGDLQSSATPTFLHPSATILYNTKCLRPPTSSRHFPYITANNLTSNPNFSHTQRQPAASQSCAHPEEYNLKHSPTTNSNAAPTMGYARCKHYVAVQN